MTLPGGGQFNADDFATVAAWAREGRIPGDARIAVEGLEPVLARDHPALQPILGVRPGESNAVAAIIPYRNPPALVGYYVSVASLIPCLALLFGPAAIVLGIVGLRRSARDEQARGKAHAIVAIILGSLTLLVNIGAIVAWMASI
ncbi:MAG: DUF4190 domain-containing protein [Phycisphaerales bacterium]